MTDQRAKDVGSSRARWAVLVRIERCEGQSQNELAASLDIQPITLGRLVDKLCERNSWIAARTPLTGVSSACI